MVNSASTLQSHQNGAAPPSQERSETGGQYLQLNQIAHEFRIVTVHAGSPEDPIECSLETFLLETPGRYEALSYTWGDATQRCNIVVNNTERSITASLECALRQLRFPDSHRRLWIDSICIDQENDAERQHQVQLMRHIYRGASRVLVWLGPEQDESDSGMELICDVGSAADDAQLFPLNESELFRAAAVEKIVRRPYWRRAWIRQEVTVPSSEPLIICGNREILWNLFDTGLYRLYKHRATERLYRVAPIVLDLRTTRNSFHSRIRREDTVSKERTNLHSLLGACRMTLATDPRDQVYGLLGLIRSVRDHSDLDIMIPDYTKSLSSVYLEAAKMYMRLEGTLEFLRFRARHPARSWLPSWVPDFSLSYDMDPTTYPSNAPLKPYKWSATGALRDQFDKPYPSLGGDGGSALITKGVILDRVAKVVEIDGTSPKAILKVRKAVLAHGAQPMTATHSIRDTVPDRELEERIWRTLVKNCDVGGRPPCPPEYGNYYYEILNDNHSYTGNGDKPTPDDGRNFLKAMRKATKATYRHAESHRQVLLFEGGIDMIGLGPPDSEHGDLLCLLGGYSMPALLRRSGKSFLFVGSVFVHGIMYGEALGSRKLSDEFVII